MYYEKFIKLKPKIPKIINLHKNYMSDYDGITQEYGNDMTFDEEGTKKAVEQFKRITELDSRKKLKSYLESLTNEELIILQSVMYIGRDNTEIITKFNIDKIFKNNSQFELGESINKNDLIEELIGKTPLADYLNEGIQKINY